MGEGLSGGRRWNDCNGFNSRGGQCVKMLRIYVQTTTIS